MSYRVSIKRRRRPGDLGRAWRRARRAVAARSRAKARRRADAAWQAGFDARTADYLANRPEALR